MNYLQPHFHLHSLTLILNKFQDIFTLISYTPNLEYLNVQLQSCGTSHRSLNQINIKLKHFYLTIGLKNQSYTKIFCAPNEFDGILDSIKQFSTSLICFSLDLIRMNVETINEIPFNSSKLQLFLESMIEIKEFYLYAKFSRYSNDKENILEGFKNQYWYDHKWYFGIHGTYFYTLPFHFDYLYEFPVDFDDIKTSYDQILSNNSQLWYNVKSIQLHSTYKYDKNFIKQLKIKIPKLNFIEFEKFFLSDYPRKDSTLNKNLIETIDLTLDNVTTIQLSRESMEVKKDWIINILPNLKHLILSSMKLSSINSSMAEIFNKQIRYLDIHLDDLLEQFIERNSIYFLNVQYMNVCLYADGETCVRNADILMKIIGYLKNLQVLMFYRPSTTPWVNQSKVDIFREYFDKNYFRENYQVKCRSEYCLLTEKLL